MTRAAAAAWSLAVTTVHRTVALYRSSFKSLKTLKSKSSSIHKKKVWIFIFWSEWRDLNPRPLGPEPSALPTALHPEILNFKAYIYHKARFGQKHCRTARLERIALLCVSSCSAIAFICHRQRQCRSHYTPKYLIVIQIANAIILQYL